MLISHISIFLFVFILTGCSAAIHPIFDTATTEHEKLSKEIKELNERIEDMNGNIATLTNAAYELQKRLSKSVACEK